MRFFAIFLIVIVSASCAAVPTRIPSSQNVMYSINGRHSVYGAFDGQVELRILDDGSSQLTRLIRYLDYRFEGFQVQEAWQAKATFQNGALNARFELKQADFLHTVDNKLQRTKDQFAKPWAISYSLPLNGSEITLKLPGSEVTERISGAAVPAPANPIWKNERRWIPVQGESHPLTAFFANNTVFRKLINRYRADPEVQAHRQRAECKTDDLYFIHDSTDFDFIRSHPNTLRVTNKITDEISLVETSLRRDAYGPTLFAKAKFFNDRYPARNMNELGLYSNSAEESPGVFKQYPSGDGALWTGTYAGAEAMRWLVTKDPSALANFRKTMKGILLLLDVMDDPKEFARTAHPYSEGEELSGNWRRGKGKHAGLKFLAGGNNDMVKVFFHSFAWAFEILPVGDALRGEVAAASMRLPALKVTQGRRFQNAFMAAGLAAIASGDPKLAARYRNLYRFAIKPVSQLGLDSGMFQGAIADWSGINLSMIGATSSILIAKLMAERFRDTPIYPGLRAIVSGTRVEILNDWATYIGARRDFLTVAALTFGVDDNALRFPRGTTPRTWNRKEKWQSELALAPWSLRETPIPRSPRAYSFDLSLSPDWCMSGWPRLPWKALKKNAEKDYPISFYYQGAVQVPLFERYIPWQENYFVGALVYKGDGAAKYQLGRMEYLHMYWMARLAGLFGENE